MHPTGSLLVKLGFITPHNDTLTVRYDTLYGELLEASGYAVRSLHSAAPVWNFLSPLYHPLLNSMCRRLALAPFAQGRGVRLSSTTV